MRFISWENGPESVRMNKENRQGDVKGNAWILRQPGPRQWWQEMRFTYCDEFADFVDGLIREGEAAE
jgi:hypothetical protein